MEDEQAFFSGLNLIEEAEDAGRHSKERNHINLDMWGSCTSKNVLKNMRKTACLKPIHVDLLRQVLDVCSTAGVAAFVYAGTALGVYREGGRMLPHDYDADLACLEYSDNQPPEGSLSKLANYCLESNIPFSGVDGQAPPTHEMDSEVTPPCIRVCLANSLESDRSWLFFDDDEIKERPFNGCGSKTAKFYFTDVGLSEAAKRLKTKLKPAQITALQYDSSNIHVDLFTLSPHPDWPNEMLRVNWHRNGMYNSLAKPFHHKNFFPLQRLTFEGLLILAPADLKGYLTAEYGYLGRDAMYDRERQCYVKIPAELRAKLPEAYSCYVSTKGDGESVAKEM